MTSCDVSWWIYIYIYTCVCDLYDYIIADSSTIDMHILCFYTLYMIYFDVYFMILIGGCSYLYIYIYICIYICVCYIYLTWFKAYFLIVRLRAPTNRCWVAFCYTTWNTGTKGFSDLHALAEIEGGGSLGRTQYLNCSHMDARFAVSCYQERRERKDSTSPPPRKDRCDGSMHEFSGNVGDQVAGHQLLR